MAEDQIIDLQSHRQKSKPGADTFPQRYTFDPAEDIGQAFDNIARQVEALANAPGVPEGIVQRLTEIAEESRNSKELTAYIPLFD